MRGPEETPHDRVATARRSAGAAPNPGQRQILALGATLAAMLSGCGTAPAAPDPGGAAVLVERVHAHRHPHGPGLDHGHAHADFPTGSHTHEHSGH